MEKTIFSEKFLLKRPLLEAILDKGENPIVLLINEIDRADEEFEGLLLELLAEFQVTIPELDTFRAHYRPKLSSLLIELANWAAGCGVDAFTIHDLSKHREGA